MFNLGLSEMILIGIIALIFIGPKQLPEIARTLGRALNELKRATDDLTSSITNPKSYDDARAKRAELLAKNNPPVVNNSHTAQTETKTEVNNQVAEEPSTEPTKKDESAT